VSDRVLVTGGAGFIGSHLVDELVRRGDQVEVIDNLDPQVHKRKPEYLNPTARYHFADLRGDGAIEHLLRNVDVVFHLAARVGVGQSMYEVERYVDVNTGGTARLLQALVADRHDVRKLIVASSMSIYGEGAYECPSCGPVSPPLRGREQLSHKRWEIACPKCSTVMDPRPTPETKHLDPNSVYAVTKRDQEELCLTVGRAVGLPTIALRFFNVYGPRQSLDNPYTGVAAIFQSRIKNKEPPVVFEDGKQSRDFVSVHDIVQACVLAMEKSSADYEPVNVGSGKPITILEVADVLLRLFQSKLTRTVEDKFRAGDVRHCFADLRKARKLLGYEPKVSFEEGMRELVAWGRSVSAMDGFQTAYEELRSRRLVEG
jgi:dTDP-L-rhamnose 4-epimerase